MTKTDCRLCVAATVLLCHTSPLFSQHLKAFNQNASRSNHTRLAAFQEQAFVLRLNGDRASSGSDGLATTASFMPGISANYYMGNWGIGAEYGAFNSTPAFNIETYIKNIQGFTVRDIVSSQWKTQLLMAGLLYRLPLGREVQLGVDVLGGMVKMKTPSYSIKDKTDGTLIADAYHDTKTTTAAESPLFALKPAIRLEWFPGQGAVGLNIHVSYLRALDTKETSTYYRDLSKVRFENASQQEIRAQVLNAPVVENRSKGPVENVAIGAGITVKIATKKTTVTRQTQGTTFGEKVNAGLHTQGIVHRDIAARNIVHRDLATRHILSGKCSWGSSQGSLGIITNQSEGTIEGLGRENSIDVLEFNPATITAREAGTGMSTGREPDNNNTSRDNTNNSRDASSGLATGRRINKVVYQDGKVSPPDHDTSIAAIEVNPLYTGSGTAGTNPIYTGNNLKGNNPLYEDKGNAGQNPMARGIAGVDVILIDVETGEIMATTKTTQSGDFYFANVPGGTYAVRISGSTTLEKAYDVRAKKDIDVSGIVRQGTVQPSLSLVTEVMDGSLTEPQMRRRVEVLKSNKTGDPNAIRMPIRTTFETGDTPTSNQAARPGTPIGGIIVKGGKNPGGNLFTTTTDRAGYFELNNLKEGNNRIIISQTIYFNDETTVVLSRHK